MFPGDILHGRKKYSDIIGYFEALDNYVGELKFILEPLEVARVECNLPPLTAEHVIAIGDRIQQLQMEFMMWER